MSSASTGASWPATNCAQPTSRPACIGTSRPRRSSTTTRRTVGHASTASSQVGFSAPCLPRRQVAVGGQDRLGLGVLEARRDRGRREAGEDRQVDRPELGDRVGGHHGLGDHRHEDADRRRPCPIPSARSARGQRIDLAAQLGERQGPDRSVLGLARDGQPVSALGVLGPAVHARGRDVDPPAGEPRRPRDAVREIDHLLVGRREAQVEVPDGRIPVPGDVVHRAAAQLPDCGDAVRAHQARDVGPLDVFGRGLPGVPAHGRAILRRSEGAPARNSGRPRGSVRGTSRLQRGCLGRVGKSDPTSIGGGNPLPPRSIPYRPPPVKSPEPMNGFDVYGALSGRKSASRRA